MTPNTNKCANTWRLVALIILLATCTLAACGKTEGAPCDRDTFTSRCDGDTAVTCAKGRGQSVPDVRREQCYGIHSMCAVVDGEATCVDPRPRCDPATFQTSCDGSTAVVCDENDGDPRETRTVCEDEHDTCDAAKGGCVVTDPTKQCTFADPERCDGSTYLVCVDHNEPGNVGPAVVAYDCNTTHTGSPDCVINDQGISRCVRGATPCPTRDAEKCEEGRLFGCVTINEPDGDEGTNLYWQQLASSCD